MRIRYSPVCYQDRSSTKSKKFRVFVRANSVYILVIISVILLASLYLTGLSTYLYEEDYLEFRYPLDIPDIRGLVERIDQFQLKKFKNNSTRNVGFQFMVDALNSIQSDGDASWKIEPLDQYKDLEFLIDIKPPCSLPLNDPSSNLEPINIVIIVKSAVNNIARREAIRKSWYTHGRHGSYNFRTVFIVGNCDWKNPVPKTLSNNGTGYWTPRDCQNRLNDESLNHGDIIQSSGIDSYYNNTVKTFMTLRWLNERCTPDFALAIDDDYVLELDYLMRHLETMASDYWPKESRSNSSAFPNGESLSSLAEKRLSRQYLWAGYLRNHVRPFRSVFSKWYVSYNEYHYDKYPPFITGGAVLMSQKTIRHLYYATYFTQPFKFDDVYMGIVAFRLGINSNHSELFMCNINEYLASKPYFPDSTNCIAVHEIEPERLVELWNCKRHPSPQCLE